MIFDRISNFCIRDRDRLSRKEAFGDKSRSAIDWNDYTDNESRTIVILFFEKELVIIFLFYPILKQGGLFLLDLVSKGTMAPYSLA